MTYNVFGGTLSLTQINQVYNYLKVLLNFCSSSTNFMSLNVVTKLTQNSLCLE